MISWPRPVTSSSDTRIEREGRGARSLCQAYVNYTRFCTRGKRDLGYDIKDGEKTVEETAMMMALYQDFSRNDLDELV